jgi:hypothetical protein
MKILKRMLYRGNTPLPAAFPIQCQLIQRYADSMPAGDLTVENLLAEANEESRSIIQPLLFEILDDLVVDPILFGRENIPFLLGLLRSKRKVLIIANHQSNFDVPLIEFIFHKNGFEYDSFLDQVVFIAGRKLSEQSKFVNAFASLYNRLQVVPKGDMSKEAMKINKASQKKMRELIKEQIIFLFPTGTRSREEQPETYWPLKETFNYLKQFDYVSLLSINGSVLVPKSGNLMAYDAVKRTKIEMKLSFPLATDSILDLTDFLSPDLDRKQFIMDLLMTHIYSLEGAFRQKEGIPWQEKN